MSKRRSKDDDEEGTCYKRFKARTITEPQHDEEMIYLRALLRQHCEKQNIDFTTSKVRSLSSSSSSSSCSSYSALSPLSSNLQSDSSFSDSSVNVSSDNVNNVSDETSDGDQNAGNKCDENCSSSTATAEYDTCIGGPDLLSLSDDVLLIILKYLHPFDLLNISRTCVRLNIVSRDRTLWTDVDFRHDINDKRYMKKVIDFDNFIKFLLPTTKSIKKNGSTKYEYAEYACTTSKTTQMSITASFFAKVSKKVKALKSFTLENHTVYGPATTLECFPSSLEHLSLKNSLVVRLPSDKSYFFKIDKVLPYLTVLDLSGCQWFQSHSFLALSKSPTLKELHLRGCLGIQDCVPYASLAATFGFPALELLDLRLTHVNDSDVSCFNRVEKLKKLYLEAVDWSDSSNKITDVGVASFGNGTTKLNENFVGLAFVLIRNQRPSECSLESIVLRNYRCVTDISLKHAAVCLPNLKHLDVSGTSCTVKGVREFKVMRPNVELLSDFNDKELLATSDE